MCPVSIHCVHPELAIYFNSFPKTLPTAKANRTRRDMNNFGVIELASAKTTSAPGWAYVPDTGALPGANALQPANRKRARNAPAGVTAGDLTARQEAKIRKEIEALERDGGKDNSIPIPAKSSKGA